MVIKMWNYISYTDLYHHGIKGQKWGVRRYQNKDGSLTPAGQKRYDDKEAYRNKMQKIAKNRNAHMSDRKRAEYATKSVGKKFVGELGKLIARQVIGDMLRGKDYSKMSKDEFIRMVKNIGIATAGKMALTEIEVKSMSKKYNAAGRAKGKQGLMSREDMYGICASTALKFYPVVNMLVGAKYAQVKANRAANKAKFESWGGNILESKFDDIVNLSSDSWRVVDEKIRRW